jgi:hypothetical protein
MRKSTIIAHCLVNSRAYSTVADAEAGVRTAFREAYPEQSCADWNDDVDADTAADLIRRHSALPALSTSPASPDMRRLIDELRPIPGASARVAPH